MEVVKFDGKNSAALFFSSQRWTSWRNLTAPIISEWCLLVIALQQIQHCVMVFVYDEKDNGT